MRKDMCGSRFRERSKEVTLFMDGWEYMQKVDYEQLPFKCRRCHEYEHFVKRFPKEVTEDPGKSQEQG